VGGPRQTTPSARSRALCLGSLACAGAGSARASSGSEVLTKAWMTVLRTTGVVPVHLWWSSVVGAGTTRSLKAASARCAQQRPLKRCVWHLAHSRAQSGRHDTLIQQRRGTGVKTGGCEPVTQRPALARALAQASVSPQTLRPQDQCGSTTGASAFPPQRHHDRPPAPGTSEVWARPGGQRLM
jgi:hypothetical protein